ncbi:hypothetical protein ACFE33_14650 [Falsihalocynthiibacter sp. SS001]|uniref:hypothetical protein n=1 Tax=Falsihalocynthiibacter sp. SS001 TaxID=3349698 RepID=UPI0036D27285
MVSQLMGAVVRGILVALLIALPSIIVPGHHSDSSQVVALLGIFLGFLTAIEYASVYPSLVEFRDAPPFNRIRYLSLLVMVTLVSVIAGDFETPSILARFTHAVGTVIGNAMDFPYSPVRLFVLALPADASASVVDLVRVSAGLCYLISLVSLAIFMIILRMGHWPARGVSFNVWVNLPTFDPTAGRDVVERLTRDARLNTILGFLLPFVAPVVMESTSSVFQGFTIESPQTLVWTVCAWAFLPASLFMRGIAMGRIAYLIQEKRQSTIAEQDGLLPA